MITKLISQLLLTILTVFFGPKANQYFKKFQVTPTMTAPTGIPIDDGPVMIEVSPTPDIISEEIKVTNPLANSSVISPLIVTGLVDNSWMFEGVFPIKLVDRQQKEITKAMAKEVVSGSWLKEGKVEFKAVLNFLPTDIGGYLVLENDNPSGLPENQKTFMIPVKFSPN